MFRKLFVGILTLLLATTTWAQEPWKRKPYKQWNETDLRKTLNDSPWVKAILVDAPWRGVFGSEKKTVTSPPPVGAVAESADSKSELDPIPSTVSSSPGELRIAQVPVVILWASSHTIRAALARSAVLQGMAQESDADSYIGQQSAEYEIVVQGPDLTPFKRANEDVLQERAFLLFKNSKAKLAPSRVRIQHAPGGKEISSVVFYFPKETVRGEPAIGSGEKFAEFHCEAGSTIFQVTFELRKMTDSHGRDL
jgi:hypothetical protein